MIEDFFPTLVEYKYQKSFCGEVLLLVVYRQMLQQYLCINMILTFKKGTSQIDFNCG